MESGALDCQSPGVGEATGGHCYGPGGDAVPELGPAEGEGLRGLGDKTRGFNEKGGAGWGPLI